MRVLETALQDSETGAQVANHKSALKANRQNIKARTDNRRLRSRLRGSLKSVRAAIDNGDTGKAQNSFRATVSLIDKMAGKKIIHANAAGRYKSRLSQRLAWTNRAGNPRY